MSKINKKLLVPIIIISIFAIYNLAWYAITSIKYANYTDNVSKNEFGIYGITDKDGYSFNVKKPGYLSYTGNIGVTSSSGNSLIIWPKITGGYEYGVILIIDNTMYQIEMDKNMKINENTYTDDIKNIVDNNRETIKTLFQKAEDMWKI